jgi:radical SAM protein with 4Fe4S-binding SPASM domain
VLLIDQYAGIKFAARILRRYKGPHNISFYPEDKDANPHRRRKIDEHLIVIAEDPSEATKGTHSSINNHCGSAFPLNDNMAGKRCAKVFREMTVRWDGNVAICCNDWRGVYKCGNVLETPIDEIWNNKAFLAARKKLYNGMRDFVPCKGCDAVSYRIGLLPDKLGKQSLPKPTIGDLRAIRQALKGKPYTKPIKRPWED